MTSIRSSSPSVAPSRSTEDAPGRKQIRIADDMSEAAASGAQLGVDDTFVRLNVGGTTYEVARDTLTGSPGMLRQLVDGSLASSRDTKGRLRLDLDGKTFRYTLNYLRHGHVPTAMPAHKRALVEIQADYLGLEPLHTELRLQALADDVGQAPTLLGHLQLADGLYDQNRDDQAWQHYNSAWAFITDAAAREAHDAHYRAAAEQHPSCPWRLSIGLLNVRDLDTTQAHVDQVARLGPKSALALCVRAMHAVQENDAIGAHKIAHEALALQPNLVEAFWLVGRTTAVPEEAVAYLKQALHLRPNYAEAYSAYGDVLRRQNNLSEARAAFNRSIQLNANDAVAHGNRGLVLHRQNDLPRALIAYDWSIHLNPNIAQVHRNRADVLYRQNDLPEALAACDRSIALDPNDALTHRYRGNILHGQNDLPDALAAYERSIALNPNDVLAHRDRGLTLLHQNDLLRALEAYERAIALSPNDARMHLSRGVVLKLQNDLPGALAAFDRSIQLNPAYVQAHSNRGAVLRQQGHLSSALAAYQQALQIDPNHHAARSGHAAVSQQLQA